MTGVRFTLNTCTPCGTSMSGYLTRAWNSSTLLFEGAALRCPTPTLSSFDEALLAPRMLTRGHINLHNVTSPACHARMRVSHTTRGAQCPLCYSLPDLSATEKKRVNTVGGELDVYALIRRYMADGDLSQDPLLILPSHRSERLPREPTGHAKLSLCASIAHCAFLMLAPLMCTCIEHLRSPQSRNLPAAQVLENRSL
jgi:hypothetical protein